MYGMLCKCGCGKEVTARPYWNSKGKHYPQYCHGHHKGALGISHPAWNKGLTKEVCPILSKMGYQPNHKPYNDWSKVNDRLKNDPKFKERWRQSKLGIPAWNKGLKRHLYPNGIKSGFEHGNWKGVGKIRDQEDYRRLRNFVFQRDKGICQKCGIKTSKKNSGHVHHIVPISQDKSKISDPFNLITVCSNCHKFLHSKVHKNQAAV